MDEDWLTWLESGRDEVDGTATVDKLLRARKGMKGAQATLGFGLHR